MYTVYLAHANLHKIPEIRAEKDVDFTHPSPFLAFFISVTRYNRLR